MSTPQFIKDLESQLGPSEKAQRYLRELSEHYEDATQNMVDEEEGDPGEAASMLGSLSQLREEFQHYLRDKEFWNTLAQSLLIGILSIPFYLGFIFLIERGIEQAFALENGFYIAISLLYILVGLGVCALGIGALYRRAIPPIFGQIPGFKILWPWIGVIFLLPISGMLLFEFTESQSTVALLGFSSYVWDLARLPELLKIAFVIGYGWIAFGWAVKELRRKTHAQPVQKRRRTKIAGILLLACLFVTQAILWLEQGSIAKERLMVGGFAIAFPRAVIESFVFGLWGATGPVLSDRIVFWILVGSMILVAGLILYQIIEAWSNRRTILWMRTVLLVYLLLLFVASPVQTPKLEIAVPFVNLTDEMDKQDFGVGYRFAQYMAQYSEKGAYANGWQRDSKFRFEKPWGTIFLLSDIQSTSDFQLQTMPLAERGAEGFSLIQDSEDFEIAEISCDGYGNEPPQDRGWCGTLYYKDKVLLQNDHPIPGWVGPMSLTPDGQFLILYIHHLPLGRQRQAWIYLLDISSIQ